MGLPKAGVSNTLTSRKNNRGVSFGQEFGNNNNDGFDYNFPDAVTPRKIVTFANELSRSRKR